MLRDSGDTIDLSQKGWRIPSSKCKNTDTLPIIRGLISTQQRLCSCSPARHATPSVQCYLLHSCNIKQSRGCYQYYPHQTLSSMCVLRWDITRQNMLDRNMRRIQKHIIWCCISSEADCTDTCKSMQSICSLSPNTALVCTSLQMYTVLLKFLIKHYFVAGISMCLLTTGVTSMQICRYARSAR